MFEGKVIADWTEDSPEDYLARVRYNPLERLWAKTARKRRQIYEV